MSDQDTTKQIRDDLRRFVDWYVAVNTPHVQDRLEEALDSTDRRIAYQLTTAGRPSTEIAEATKTLGDGTAASTVRLWQREWMRLGLVRQVSAQKRERIFDLEELGIGIGADLSQYLPSETDE